MKRRGQNGRYVGGITALQCSTALNVALKFFHIVVAVDPTQLRTMVSETVAPTD